MTFTVCRERHSKSFYCLQLLTPKTCNPSIQYGKLATILVISWLSQVDWTLLDRTFEGSSWTASHCFCQVFTGHVLVGYSVIDSVQISSVRKARLTKWELEYNSRYGKCPLSLLSGFKFKRKYVRFPLWQTKLSVITDGCLLCIFVCVT